MKFLMIIVLIALCTYVGFGFSKYYVQRYIFFKEFREFLNKFNLKINFSKDKLQDVVKNHNSKNKNIISLLNNFLEGLENKKLTKENLLKHIKILKDEEKDIIFNFFSQVGHFDLLGQTRQIENYNKLFEDIEKTAEIEKNKFSPLFIKLGLIIGVVISLILL